MTRKPRSRTPLALTASLVATLALAGCGVEGVEAAPTASASASEDPSTSPEPESESASEPEPPRTDAAATVEVRIRGGSVTPVAQQADIGVGETLLLDIDSDRAGELHVHSTPEQQVAVDPGRKVVEVRLDKPGTVDIEEHDSGVLIVRVLVR